MPKNCKERTISKKSLPYYDQSGMVMDEKFLHFVWRFQLIRNFPLITTDGREVEIVNRGTWNEKDAGPDFALAKIKIKKRTWVGNVEIHIRSSDWNLHKHSIDPAYKNIILHVVLDHDKEINFLKEKHIPTLELKNHLSRETLENYIKLLQSGKKFIPCENNIQLVQREKIDFWLERISMGRLERKSKEKEENLHKCGKNWEELLFKELSFSFGLKINAEAFALWADSFDYKVLQKVQSNPDLVYALFFGQAGFLENQSKNPYVQKLQKDYAFLQNKHNLESINKSVFRFFRLYPASFPTVRMMQLATVYARYPNLFSYLMGTKSAKKIYPIFEDLDYPDFWKNHYTMEKESKKENQKKMSHELIDRLMINVILPVKFLYAGSLGIDVTTELPEMLRSLPPEKNSIIKGFETIGIKAQNALESQALLEMKRHFCDEKKCLNCAIGLHVLKDV